MLHGDGRTFIIKRTDLVREDICPKNSVQVVIGKEDYFLSAGGFLMPIKNDSRPGFPLFQANR